MGDSFEGRVACGRTVAPFEWCFAVGPMASSFE